MRFASMTPLVVVVAAAATLITLAPVALVGCDRAVPEQKLTAPVTYRLSVKGMHCEGCESAICDKVGKIAGVTACKASHTAEDVEVIAPVEQKAAIVAAITRLGYTVGEK
jgi:copper chaperone CopZ